MIGAEPLKRISDGLNRIVLWACIVLVTVMLSISTFGIILEVTFNTFEMLDAGETFADSPLAWLYSQTRPSMTRLFLPWVAMLSITVAFKSGEHVAISLLVRRLTPGMLRLAQSINLAAVAFFGIALVWYGIGFFQNSTQFFMVSDSLQVSHKWTAMSVPVCGIIMCVHLLSGLSLVEHVDFVGEGDDA